MPVHAEWDAVHTNCIIMELTSPLTWDAFHSGIRAAHDQIRSTSRRVTIIIHVHARLPEGAPLYHFREAFQDQPDNVERVIVVANRFQPFLFNFIKRIAVILQHLYPFKSKIVFTDTLEQAYALLTASRNAQSGQK